MNCIELRSDILTQYTQQMRDSILTSSYGDWTYGEDETVKTLEKYAAEMAGKQAAAFVPSAVFGNQCAMLTAGRPGEEVIINEASHIISNQNGSVGCFARMMTRTITCPEGFITPELLAKFIRINPDSQSPHTSILVIENPTFQGLIPPTQVFHASARLAKAHGLHVHVDAARLFNAVCELKIPVQELMKECDSFTLCLSKGLLAPVGSLVFGSSEFIGRFKKNQKMMGGFMRKPGVIAGAALIALQKHRFLVHEDNQMARELASTLEQRGIIKVTVPVHTNQVFFRFTDTSFDLAALQAVLKSKSIHVNLSTKGVNRLVFHYYVRQPQVDLIVETLASFFKKEQ